MIHVLLTSELPWQCNDTCTCFICLRISRYEEFFSNHLTELLPPLVTLIMAKFERILFWKYFETKF